MIGGELADRLVAKFGSQAKAAAALDMTPANVSNLIRGPRRITPVIAARIARALGDHDFGLVLIAGQNTIDRRVAEAEYGRVYDSLERLSA